MKQLARFGSDAETRQKLKPATLLKVLLLHGMYSLNCTNDTKSRKGSRMKMKDIIEISADIVLSSLLPTLQLFGKRFNALTYIWLPSHSYRNQSIDLE